ncbi:putative nucleic acid binding protein [Trypanosoma theileri]|uniref:Putative nucleic acid binding protein n=1 Tax=Trypanosoma theileri TaxID=67003 RepID=A0A1X0NV36_9TRYP|nr:putative nucleic acid binding protein [Trypanosoma theileri]ORC88554.1 putative nucleic acid binding protein [Trypanosoma theileri]
MRADWEDIAPAVPAKGEDFVICSAHRSRRLAKCCSCEPVRNADRVTIGYTYRCREGMECARAAERASHPNQQQNGTTSNSRTGTIVQPSITTETSTQAGDAAGGDSVPAPDVDAVPQQQQQQQQQQQAPRSGTSRGPNRYYDLTNQRNTDGTGTKKVCWNCGMEGHEKPDCPNALCKTCHTTRNYHHICQEPHPSPFLILSSTLPFSDEMKLVQCVSCHSVGHFDCSPRSVEKSSSCCFCGGMGHNAFDCRQRKDRVPDRWVTRILANENGSIQKGGYDGSLNFPSRSTPGNTSASYDRQTYGYNERGEFPRSDNRYTYARENGNYGRDGNTGGYCASNSHTYGERRPNSRQTENNYKMSYSEREGNWGSRRGEKRSRWDDDEDSYHHGGRTSGRRNYDWGSERDSRSGRNYVDSYAGDGGRRRTSDSYHNHNHNHHHHHHRDRHEGEQQQHHHHKHRRNSRYSRDSDDDFNEPF